MKPKIPSSIEYVHLQWDGPITWEEKAKLASAIDYGVYQIYGYHPVHGVDSLLYIGKASRQSFAVRLSQQVDWIYDADFGRLNIYVGRCSGWDRTPSIPLWERQIDLRRNCSSLLIVRDGTPKRISTGKAKTCRGCTSSTGDTIAAFCPKSLVCAIHPFSMTKRSTNRLPKEVGGWPSLCFRDNFVRGRRVTPESIQAAQKLERVPLPSALKRAAPGMNAAGTLLPAVTSE